MISRREWLQTAVAGAAAIVAAPASLLAAAAEKPRRFTIYKSPTCGCCRLWVTHAQGVLGGWQFSTHDVDDLSDIKARLGVPNTLQSCHTAITGPYVFEGHVPADLIKRFVAEQPRGALGLAVPGMPVGSPGMEMGARKDPYDVILFDRAGKTRVYAKR